MAEESAAERAYTAIPIGSLPLQGDLGALSAWFYAGHAAAEAALLPRVEALELALRDIADGMAPPEVMKYLELESPEEFRGRMWGWSQKRARAALAEQEDAGG